MDDRAHVDTASRAHELRNEPRANAGGLPRAVTPVRLVALSVPDMETEKAFLLAACQAAMVAYRQIRSRSPEESPLETDDEGEVQRPARGADGSAID